MMQWSPLLETVWDAEMFSNGEWKDRGMMIGRIERRQKKRTPVNVTRRCETDQGHLWQRHAAQHM